MCLTWLSDTSFSYRIIVGTGGFLGGPNVAIGNLFYWLMANSHSHSFWGLEAVCAMVYFVPCPPTISFTHQFHTDMSQPVLCSHQVLTLHQDLAWLDLSHLCLTPCLLTPPSLHSALLHGLMGFGCSLNVSHQWHPHIMLLTQHCLPKVFCFHPSFSLCFLFFILFWGGLEAVNPGWVHSPLAAFLVSFYALYCLVIGVVFVFRST